MDIISAKFCAKILQKFLYNFIYVSCKILVFLFWPAGYPCNNDLSFINHDPLFINYDLLFIIHYLLFTNHNLMLFYRDLLFINFDLLFINRDLLFVSFDLLSYWCSQFWILLAVSGFCVFEKSGKPIYSTIVCKISQLLLLLITI